MKKLGKLKLQKEKMLSHEELVNFRGGSGGGYGECSSQGCWFLYCTEINGSAWAYWECPNYEACIEKDAVYCLQ